MRVMLAITLLLVSLSSSAQEVDPSTGLIKNPGWEIIKANCSACHSLNLVTSNRGNREEWLTTIRWMQKTQKLWQFDPATEDTILNYLAQSYPATKQNRRQPIPNHLLPQ